MTSAHAESSTEGTEPNRDTPTVITVVSRQPITVGANVFARGDVIQIDDNLVAATTDLSGDSFLYDLSDEKQRKRWGRVVFALEDVSDRIREGDRRAEAERERAQARIDDESGLAALRQGWAEEDLARQNPASWRSRTISTARPIG